MKKIIALLTACSFLFIGMTTANASTETQPVSSASATVGPNPVTYCDFGSGNPPSNVYKPYKYRNGSNYEIHAKGYWVCSPYTLVWMKVFAQLQKQDSRGIMRDYYNATYYYCGKSGEPLCPYNNTIRDSAGCYESGWYRTQVYLEGYGPKGTETWNLLGPLYSNKVYISC